MSSVPNYGRHRYDDDFTHKPKPTHLRIATAAPGTKAKPKAAKQKVRSRKVNSRAKGRPQVKQRIQPAAILTQVLVIGLMAAIVTYGFSVLMGKSMAEKDSREIGLYHTREKVAEAEANAIRQRLDFRVNPKKVEDWAQNNGFTKDAGAAK